MKETPSILIIILNWRQPAVTLKCVEAVRQMTYPDFSLLVIDNGSDDDSNQIFTSKLKKSEFLPLSENLGFAGGCNIGLRAAIQQGYEYALLLNNDAFPTVDMLTHLVDAAETDVGLISPRIYYAEDPQRIWFANGRQHPLTLDLRDTGQGDLERFQFPQILEVDYLVGTCLLVNLTAVSRVGLLDERYFMYYEDLDWSIRFRDAGYKLKVVGSAHLYHQVAVSTGGNNSPIHRYHLARNSVVFWYTHGARGNRFIIFWLRVGNSTKTLIHLLIQREWPSIIAHLRGLKAGWRAVTGSQA